MEIVMKPKQTRFKIYINKKNAQNAMQLSNKYKDATIYSAFATINFAMSVVKNGKLITLDVGLNQLINPIKETGMTILITSNLSMALLAFASI